MKTTTKLVIGLGILAVATPLGLYLPAAFKAGSAWGEWGAEEVGRVVGYVPKGMEKLSSLWHAPLPGYALSGMDHADPGHLSMAYIFSAVIGIALCMGGGLLLGRLLLRKKNTVGKEH